MYFYNRSMQLYLTPHETRLQSEFHKPFRIKPMLQLSPMPIYNWIQLPCLLYTIDFKPHAYFTIDFSLHIFLLLIVVFESKSSPNITCIGLGGLSLNCHHSTLTRLRADWKALCNWSFTFLSQRDFFPALKNSLHPPPTRAMARRKCLLALELDEE